MMGRGLGIYSIRTTKNVIDDAMTRNAEEADTIMWLHASKTGGERILLHSPDTDILFISLIMVNPLIKDVCLHVNPLGKPKQVLSITKLIEALKNDPYLRHPRRGQASNLSITVHTIRM